MSDMVSETVGGGGKVGEPVIRTFSTGATRNLDVNKLDYDGFVSPLVMESFAKYMHSHRLQKDGTMRAADNWQKGIGFDVYMKSMWRHFFDVWKMHRGHKAYSPEDGHELTMEEALNAVAFNVNGYMHELLKAEAKACETLAAADNECDNCCPVCPLPADAEQSYTQDDGDDMVTFTVPADLAWLIGLVGASTFVMCAICLILRFIWKFQ